MNTNNRKPPRPVYLANGRKFRTLRMKHTLCVEYSLGSGGQGTAFLVWNLDMKKKQVLKIIHKILANKDTLRRLEFLVDLRLHTLSRVFKSPLDIVVQDGFIGYVADYAEGDPIDIVVEKAGIDLMQALMASLILAQNFMPLHEMGLLHSDIKDRNFKIHVVDDNPFVWAIDWDSLRAPNLPPSPFVGATRYMAPEIHKAQAERKEAILTESSECFSFAAIFHELITLRYYLAGYDQSPEAVAEKCRKGRWVHDFDSTLYRTIDGYPPGILDATLASLFRRAFSLDIGNRPLLCEWVDALAKSMRSIFPCPRCKKPAMVDPSKIICPHCNKPYPTLKVVTPMGRHIVVNSNEVIVGRRDLGGSKAISRKHLYLRKIGADVYAQSTGKKGSFRLNGHGWERLEDQVLVPIEHGQRIRMVDAEIGLECCEMDGRPFNGN